MPSEVRSYDSKDQMRDVAVAMFKHAAKIARPDTDYDADIDYLEDAVLAVAEEFIRTGWALGWEASRAASSRNLPTMEAQDG